MQIRSGKSTISLGEKRTQKNVYSFCTAHKINSELPGLVAKALQPGPPFPQSPTTL